MARTAPRDSDFDRVCQTLPRLTPTQLEQVRLRLGFLGDTSATATPSAKQQDDYDWLLRGVEDELRRRGLLGAGRLPADRIAPTWSAVSEAVRADLRREIERSGHRWRHPLVALGRVAARALADYLVAGRVRVTPRTMLVNVDKVLLAIDAAYPGYVEAGLLHCCLDPRLVGTE